MLQQETRLRSTTQTPYNTLPDCSKLCSYFTLPNLAKQLLHSIVLYHYITAQYSTAQNNYFIIIYNTALHQTTTITRPHSTWLHIYFTFYRTLIELHRTIPDTYGTAQYHTVPLHYKIESLQNRAIHHSTFTIQHGTIPHRTFTKQCVTTIHFTITLPDETTPYHTSTLLNLTITVLHVTSQYTHFILTYNYFNA